MHYLAHELEPSYRPKVYKVMVKQYGLRKAVRVATRKNSGFYRAKTQK